ncbi:glycosyltransferase family 4 protein [Trinickia sp. EG282A]|uniref:glycosyltransferase family 4 protein n=1 Tax=Trinickia sp. EG282A TaxID=3237013 RepID=UPI0034D37725
MMRILHLVLAPRLSGAEVLVKDLAAYQRRQGHPVWVTSLLPEQEDFTPLRAALDNDGVVCRFPRRRYPLLGKLWHLFRVARRFRPDVVFAHATIPSFYARALPIAVPIVFVMHSATNDFAYPVFRGVERILRRRARAVIGVSQANVDDYIAAVGAHPVMSVIPNGVDVSRFSTVGRPQGGKASAHVVQVGRYTAVKNQLQTVRAFREVLTEVPTARLGLYGVIEDPAYHQSVIELTHELGIADRVTIEGPRSDIPHLLSEANVFAMPSLSEAHSIAFIEALASGVPIVANAIPSFVFAKRLKNVQLIEANDTMAFARALVVALRQERAERRLHGLTLADTADQYGSIASRVVYGRGA